MYNLEIGRRVLALHNEGKQHKLSAKEFFDEVMFPAFFDVEEDSLHLMHVDNSSFFQSYSEKSRITGRTLGSLRHERHHEWIAEVMTGKKSVSGSIAVGYSASGPEGKTAGQVSTLRQQINSESIALTWIGAACGIGLAGGFNILIDDNEILNFVAKGWAYYRRFLTENTIFKGRQLETWNGLWVVYGFDAPNLEESYRRVIDKIPEHQGITTKNESNLSERPDWFQMFLNLAQNTELPRRLQAYGYKFAPKGNTTLGFLAIELAPIKRLSDVFHNLLNATYPNQYSYSTSQVELRKIFKTHYNLSDMVAHGGISIRTLRPAKVEAFMKANKPQKIDNNPLYSILIKSWIIAMLNNDELADLARDLGLALCAIEKNPGPTATTKIENLLNAGSKTAFIMAANELKEHKGVIDIEAAVRVLKKSEDAAQRQIPIDQLPLFRALAKSDYIMEKHFPTQQNTQPINL